MADRARKLLDELLGPCRDMSEQQIQHQNLSDYCIYHIIGICPFFALEDTKGFIDKCQKKTHKMFPLKWIDSQWQQSSELELLKTCQIIVCDIEIRKLFLNDRYIYTPPENEQSILRNHNHRQDITKKAFERDASKKMICYICGIQISNNVQSKEYISHANSKLHKSYEKIRQVLKTLMFKYKIELEIPQRLI